MKEKNQMTKGSMTVEAALVMPVVLMIMFALILLTMYIYNRTWYEAASSEAVITASTEGVRSCGDVDRILAGKMTERMGRQGFLLADISAKTISGKKEVKAEVRIKSLEIMGIGAWDADILEKAGIVRPVPFIRNIQALKAWKGE